MIILQNICDRLCQPQALRAQIAALESAGGGAEFAQLLPMVSDVA